MSTMTIAALREEIAQLEREVARHRHALRILEGKEDNAKPQAPRPAGQPSQQRTQGKTPQARKGAAKSRPPVSPRQAPQSPLRVLIQDFLRSRAPQMFSPSEIAKELSQRGQSVNKDNIQRRLSDLVKGKTVTRKEGRYGVAK